MENSKLTLKTMSVPLEDTREERDMHVEMSKHYCYTSE